MLPWLAILTALIGNCGFWLFCFNRVNAIGFHRKLAKRLEKLCVLLCFLIPTAVVLLQVGPIANWIDSERWWPPGNAPLLYGWCAWSFASFVVLGPLWLESRFWLIPPKNLLTSTGELHNVHAKIPGGSVADATTRWLARIPLNELAHLHVTRKELRLPRSVAGIDGLKIGHISDLHFTGQYRAEHYVFVLERFQELQPDLIVLTGDLIDYDRCVPMVPELLSRLSAPLGVYFLLGNHDQRLERVDLLLEQMEAIGHIDVGRSDRVCEANGTSIYLTGREWPWFERHDKDPETKINEFAGLRIGLAHSPDQIRWARARELDLLFAGHTHGGQARIPGIGPLVAPSLYGSKFASGVFFLPPTLMHVSRGVAGTHPLRWRCPPEVSLITLRNPSSS